MKIKNKSSYNVKHKENGEFVIYKNYEEDILNVLGFLLRKKVSKIGEYKNSWLIEIDNKVWDICDNGGEFNISLVNSNTLPISIAYVSSSNYFALNPATMAYRLSKVIENYKSWNEKWIDWNFIYADSNSERLVNIGKKGGNFLQ